MAEGLKGLFLGPGEGRSGDFRMGRRALAKNWVQRRWRWFWTGSFISFGVKMDEGDIWWAQRQARRAWFGILRLSLRMLDWKVLEELESQMGAA